MVQLRIVLSRDRAYIFSRYQGGSISNLTLQEHVDNASPNPTGAKSILVAEDEPLIRGLLHNVLERWGYHAIVAHDGKEALEIADRHPGEIDLLLTDITMPTMDGQELADKLTKQRPTIKVILMSGYSRFQIVLRSGWEFIQKPFKPSEVKQKIDEIL